MGVSQQITTSVRLGVFDALQQKPQTAAELASAMKCSLHGMQVLLESLDGFGFVQRQGKRYQLCKFVRSRPRRMSLFLNGFHFIWFKQVEGLQPFLTEGSFLLTSAEF